MMKAACCAIGLLCGAFCASVSGKDVTLYKVSKGFHYQQTNGAPTPTILTANGYVFEAQVNLALPGAVTSAIVESTEGTDRVLTPDGDDQFEFRSRVNSLNTLETRYPEGPFTLTINTVHDGRQVVTLSLTGNAYPSAPRIANLAQLQSMNANGYVIVRWDPFARGTAADFIQLRIEEADGDLAYETPDFGEAGALDGTATYAILEPGSLKAGQIFQATLRFDKTSTYGISTYVGVPDWSTHHALTRFAMASSAAPPPTIESYTLAKGRRFDQQSAEPPIPDLNDEFVFSAEVKFSSDNEINVVLLPPTGEAIGMRNTRGESSYDAEATTQGALDTNFPSGIYTFSVELPEGTRALSLPISGDAYPPVPRLTNFDPSEEVRADRSLVLEWEPWGDGSANDFIQLRIEEIDDKLVFETRDFGERRALTGRATFAIVPGGTLEAGKMYRATLQFTRTVALDDTSNPGSLGISRYFSRTKFRIVAGRPDLAGFSIAKGREYKQTATNVVPVSHTFSAIVSGVSDGALQSVSLEVPGRGVLPLRGGGAVFSFAETYATQAALDAAFPNGTYRLVVRGTNDGLRTLSMDLAGNGYPNAPVINEYDAMGAIFPWFESIMSWSPFEGGESRDFILLDMLDRNGAVAFMTGDYGRDGSMSGIETGLMVPAEILEFNAAYTGRLMFERVTPIQDPGYPGVAGRAGYFSRTRWTMYTLGDGNPTSFKGWSRAADGSLEFTFPSVMGANYVIEGSTDLVNWSSVTTLSTPHDQAVFRIQPGAPRYFYRAVLTR